MAIYKDYAITLDTKRSPKVALQNIVAGETGNRLTVTLTNDDIPVELSASNRVVLRVDSDEGTRFQDSSDANDGISFADGNAVIILSPDTYAAGLNRARIKVYSTASVSNDTLIYSEEFLFEAKKPDGDAPCAWHRGSTPTHEFTTGIDLTGGTVNVTYEQDGKVVVNKVTADMTITSSKVSWTLTAADTLAMAVGDIDIQLHYTKNGVSDSSDIHKGKVLYTAGV